MRFQDTVSIGFTSLQRNRGRAFLTMLGIVIGVSSVMLMLAVGNGAERFILSQIASFGSDLLFIRNGPGDGKQGAGPPTSAVKQTLTIRDYERVRALNWVRTVGAYFSSDLLVEGPAGQMRTRASGVTESEMMMFRTELEHGLFFSSEDVNAQSHVAVLGHDLAFDLFGNEDPIGKQVKIQRQTYRVIGLLKPAGTRFFTDLDRTVYVPVTTLMTQLNQEWLQYMTVKIGDTPPAEAKARLRVLLRETHRISNSDEDLSRDDFFIATQEDVAERAGIIGTILQILLSSIASISLIVGGVGIMNIMYVAVTERTREIGLRMAIGARSADILAQFLAEAIMLSLFAGILGVLFGVFFSYGTLNVLAVYQPGWSFEMPWNAMGLGFSVAVMVGVVFGYFPARRAAHLHPIEALRYE